MRETEGDIIARYVAIWRGLRPEARTEQKWADLVLCCREDIARLRKAELMVAVKVASA